eukprot:TRINITY_DN22951_c2_g1_i1.p1 TRINITY_DN22951_c2_g1~~TRINITY_DN22951_c2_g1_i1.p1  ORF type:complete len:462 (+),score=65.44 TRINITY_DN22951_c2_g1_i1:98-1483(+)
MSVSVTRVITIKRSNTLPASCFLPATPAAKTPTQQPAAVLKAQSYRRLPTAPNLTVPSSPQVGYRQVVSPRTAGSGKQITVVVLAPGAGTGFNGKTYSELGRDSRFQVQMKGQKGAPYDRYPASWAPQPNCAPPPNLESFAGDLVKQGVAGLGDVLVVGSRGGQVILPSLWREVGAQVPPCVVINGGCAMKLPGAAFQWPESAITFLLIGGQDYFRDKSTPDEYLEKTKKAVPGQNSTTAILYVKEMQHMPQSDLFRPLLNQMITVLNSWKAAGTAPMMHLQNIVTSLGNGGWNGSLWYTEGPGKWQELSFGRAQGSPCSPNSLVPHRRRQLRAQTVHFTVPAPAFGNTPSPRNEMAASPTSLQVQTPRSEAPVSPRPSALQTPRSVAPTRSVSFREPEDDDSEDEPQQQVQRQRKPRARLGTEFDFVGVEMVKVDSDSSETSVGSTTVGSTISIASSSLG